MFNKDEYLFEGKPLNEVGGGELDAITELAYKYERLVWYGRSGCNFDKYSPELQEQVREARFRVEANYPEDIKQYLEGNGDWKHGFNSGCLAAFRFAETAFDRSTSKCEDDPDAEELCWGGVENAFALFPELDT